MYIAVFLRAADRDERCFIAPIEDLSEDEKKLVAAYREFDWSEHFDCEKIRRGDSDEGDIPSDVEELRKCIEDLEKRCADLKQWQLVCHIVAWTKRMREIPLRRLKGKLLSKVLDINVETLPDDD